MNIMALRKKKGLSKEDLASLVGVSAVSIWNWETNRTKPHKTFEKKLKEVLGVDEEVKN